MCVQVVYVIARDSFIILWIFKWLWNHFYEKKKWLKGRTCIWSYCRNDGTWNRLKNKILFKRKFYNGWCLSICTNIIFKLFITTFSLIWIDIPHISPLNYFIIDYEKFYIPLKLSLFITLCVVPVHIQIFIYYFVLFALFYFKLKSRTLDRFKRIYFVAFSLELK